MCLVIYIYNKARSKDSQLEVYSWNAKAKYIFIWNSSIRSYYTIIGWWASVSLSPSSSWWNAVVMRVFQGQLRIGFGSSKNRSPGGLGVTFDGVSVSLTDSEPALRESWRSSWTLTNWSFTKVLGLFILAIVGSSWPTIFSHNLMGPVCICGYFPQRWRQPSRSPVVVIASIDCCGSCSWNRGHQLFHHRHCNLHRKGDDQSLENSYSQSQRQQFLSQRRVKHQRNVVAMPLSWICWVLA